MAAQPIRDQETRSTYNTFFYPLFFQQFLEEVENAPAGNGVDKNIIGQFGVGFYSAFMVGEKLDVYTKSYQPDAQPLKWSSDGWVEIRLYCFIAAQIVQVAQAMLFKWVGQLVHLGQ